MDSYPVLPNVGSAGEEGLSAIPRNSVETHQPTTLGACKEGVRAFDYEHIQALNLAVGIPLVIAPKATEPFVRFCEGYRWLNEYVLKSQAYIPRVQYEVE